MKEENQLVCIVEGPEGLLNEFRASANNRHDKDTDHLESNFYSQNGALIPMSTHYELKILSGPRGLLTTKDIHIHQNPHTKHWFACYTQPLPSLAEAKAFFEVWCVGTLYTLVYKKDFAPILQVTTAGAETNDPFFTHMRSQHNITLIEPHFKK